MLVHNEYTDKLNFKFIKIKRHNTKKILQLKTLPHLREQFFNFPHLYLICYSKNPYPLYNLIFEDSTFVFDLISKYIYCHTNIRVYTE